MPSHGLTSVIWGLSQPSFLLTYTSFNQILAALPHEYRQPCYRHMLLQTQETRASLYYVPEASIKELLQTKLNVSLSAVSASHRVLLLFDVSSSRGENRKHLKSLNLNITHDFLHYGHYNIHIFMNFAHTTPGVQEIFSLQIKTTESYQQFLLLPS